jgi:hypothetical protein
MKRSIYFLLLLLLPGFFLCCKKQTFITDKDAALTITADTLRFDTVFTSVGSVTQYFTLVNSNTQKLRISSIKLMGGSSSAYKINVDGMASPEVSNVELLILPRPGCLLSWKTASGSTIMAMKNRYGCRRSGKTLISFAII